MCIRNHPQHAWIQVWRAHRFGAVRTLFSLKSLLWPETRSRPLPLRSEAWCRTERSSFRPFPPTRLHFWEEGGWLQEVNQIEGMAARTPRLRAAEGGCRVQSCSESLRGSPACLIVKEGGGWTKCVMREKGGNTLQKLWQKLAESLAVCVWYVKRL